MTILGEGADKSIFKEVTGIASVKKVGFELKRKKSAWWVQILWVRKNWL